jgi:hypothetical protein
MWVGGLPSKFREALTIVRALADRVNAENGELLTADLVYQYAPVMQSAPWGRGSVGDPEGQRRLPQDAAGK